MPDVAGCRMDGSGECAEWAVEGAAGSSAGPEAASESEASGAFSGPVGEGADPGGMARGRCKGGDSIGNACAYVSPAVGSGAAVATADDEMAEGLGNSAGCASKSATGG